MTNEYLGKICKVQKEFITIEKLEWAPGIWAGAENCKIEIISFDEKTSKGIFQIDSIDLFERTLKLKTFSELITQNDIIKGFI